MDSPQGSASPHILILDDDTSHQELCLRSFRDDPERFRVSVAGNIRAAREIIERDPPDLIIADWVLPGGKGLDVLPRAGGKVTTPLIIMTSFGDEHLAVEIMKSGAIDYVVKSATMFHDLPHIARRALRDWENIRERKRAETAVQESQKRLADILAFLPDATFAIDQEGRVIAWNRAIEKMTGVSSAEMAGKGDHEYSIPFYGERRPILIDLVLMDDAEIEQKYDYIQRENGRITSEAFIPGLSGGRGAYLWGTASPLSDAAGNCIGAIEVIRDISERKRTEIALEKSEDRFRHISGLTSDFAYSCSRSAEEAFSIDWITGACQKITGYPDEEILKMGCWRGIVAEEDLPVFNEKICGLLPGNTSQCELRIRTKDGAITWLRCFAECIRDPGNPALFRLFGGCQDITGRKNADDALQESERNLSRAQEIGHIGNWNWDVTGNRLVWSDEIYRIFGVPRDFPLIFDAIAALIHPDDRKRINLTVKDFLADGNTVESEFRIIRPDGKERWLYQKMEMAKDPSGSTERAFGIIQDITDRKVVEQALFESEKKYRFLVDNVRDILWQTTTDLTFTYVSPAAELLIGYSPGELIGTSLFGILTESSARDVQKRLRDRMEEFSTGGRDLATTFEIEIIQKGGGTRWFEVSSNAVFGPDESIAGFQGISRDITDRKRAESALMESEERYRGLMNHLPDYVIVHRDGILLYVNPSAAARMGYDQETLVGRPILPLIDPVYHGTIQKAIAQRMEGEDLPSYEIKIVTKDGALRTVLVNGVMIQYGGGPASLNVLTDITLLKEAEEIRKASEIRLDSAMEIGSLAWWEMDLPEGTVRFDDRKAGMLGYSPDQFHHYTDFTALLHPDDYEPAMQAMRDHLEGREPRYHVDYRIRAADGGYRWFRDVGGITKRHHGGSPATVTGIVIDISTTKKAEETLRESEERFRTLLQGVPTIAVQGYRPDGTVFYWNEASSRLYGYSPEEVMGRDISSLIIPPPLREYVSGAIRRMAETGLPEPPGEVRLMRRDGSLVPVFSSHAVIRLSGLEPELYCLDVDLTGRIAAEEALAESEERLRLALEGADIASWDWDLASGNAVFSDMFYTMLGYEPGEFPATYEELVKHMHPDDRQRVLPDLQKQIAEKRPLCEIEYRLMTKDANWLWVLSRGKIAGFDGAGNQSRLTGVNIDITSRRLMESEIRSLNTVLEERVMDRTEALEKANQALEEENAQRLVAERKLQGSYDEKVMLLKEIHHRVKNNLQIIASLLNLQSRYITDEKTLAAIRESQNRVKAMALVHEKLYRSEDIAHISLHDYIRFLGTGLFQFYDARVRGIQFNLDIHEVNVDIDAAIPLGLIINELISNSLKYAFPEGRKGEISVSVKKEDHAMTVIFRDTGIGIPPDLDWRNTQSLGLRLVNTLVDQMNGTVELDRSGGTRFTMVLHEKE